MHDYNWIPPMPDGSKELDELCSYMPDACKAFVDAIIDESVMNVDRLPVLVSDTPAG